MRSFESKQASQPASRQRSLTFRPVLPFLCSSVHRLHRIETTDERTNHTQRESSESMNFERKTFSVCASVFCLLTSLISFDAILSKLVFSLKSTVFSSFPEIHFQSKWLLRFLLLSRLLFCLAFHHFILELSIGFISHFDWTNWCVLQFANHLFFSFRIIATSCCHRLICGLIWFLFSSCAAGVVQFFDHISTHIHLFVGRVCVGVQRPGRFRKLAVALWGSRLYSSVRALWLPVGSVYEIGLYRLLTYRAAAKYQRLERRRKSNTIVAYDELWYTYIYICILCITYSFPARTSEINQVLKNESWANK